MIYHTLGMPNPYAYTLWQLNMFKPTKLQNLWKNCHNYTNLEQSQMLFHMHQQHIVPDYCAKYEQNHPILQDDITTNSQYFNMKKLP